jgi:tetratricopeptide (TPR) repeat protein
MMIRIVLSLALVAGLAFAQPKPKSQKEADAIMAIFNAQTPDARIEAAEKLLADFADTEFKGVALQVAAASAQEKNDFEKMVVYAERTLEADPKNYAAMLMLANGIATRTREHDLDKEEKLARSEKYAKEAIELIKTAQKPRPDISDADWKGATDAYTAQAHEALGQTAVVRKKYDDAITNYQAALNLSAEPATMVRLAAAYNQAKKPDEAIATLDKLNATPELHPAIKAAAAQERNNAVKLKGGAATPGSPATPAKPAAPGAPGAPATPTTPPAK